MDIGRQDHLVQVLLLRPFYILPLPQDPDDRSLQQHHHQTTRSHGHPSPGIRHPEQGGAALRGDGRLLSQERGRAPDADDL